MSLELFLSGVVKQVCIFLWYGEPPSNGGPARNARFTKTLPGMYFEKQNEPPDLRPKEFGAVVLLDEEQVIRAVGREDSVYVVGLFQPKAAHRREKKRKGRLSIYG